MRKLHILRAAVAGLLALTLLAAVPPSARALPELPPEPTFDGYLVKLDPNGPVPLSDFPTGDGSMTRVAETVYKTNDPVLAEELLEIGVAEHVEPNYIVTLDAPITGPAEPTIAETSWNYDRMAAACAQELGLDGTGVRIGIIDSGLEPDNPNLAGAQILSGQDYITPKATAMYDNVGHGSCVAQTIVGRGIQGAARGIAPRAEIVPLRCFDCTAETTLEMLYQAILDAAYVYDCQIINMSWGLKKKSQIIEEAVQRVRASGVVLVAAAGNVGDGVVKNDLVEPAAYPGVISVGAIDRDGSPSSFTVYNAMVDVSAPGRDIPFLKANSHELFFNSGTSFASPAVAGVAALLLQYMPDLSTDEVERVLADGAVSEDPNHGRTDERGWGEVCCDALFTTGCVGMDQTAQGRRARIWVAEAGVETLVAALYSDAGQLLNCAVTPVGGPLQAVTVHLIGEQGKLRLFRLDGAGAPVGTETKELPVSEMIA